MKLMLMKLIVRLMQLWAVDGVLIDRKTGLLATVKDVSLEGVTISGGSIFMEDARTNRCRQRLTLWALLRDWAPVWHDDLHQDREYFVAMVSKIAHFKREAGHYPRIEARKRKGYTSLSMAPWDHPWLTERDILEMYI